MPKQYLNGTIDGRGFKFIYGGDGRSDKKFILETDPETRQTLQLPIKVYDPHKGIRPAAINNGIFDAYLILQKLFQDGFKVEIGQYDGPDPGIEDCFYIKK